jgi:hypothetical protein
MPQPQRLPVTYGRNNSAAVGVLHDETQNDRIIHLGDEVRELQSLSTTPIARALRRWLFVWLRVYVRETKHGKSEKVNISIPLPIPILGATFARQLSFQQAARLASQARRGEINVDEALESAMGLEFVRVEEEHPERNKSQLVVIGLD